MCEGCNAPFQLKSSAKWSTDRIVDAAYDSMMRAIRSNQTPNLLILQYTSDWFVQNLLLVPSFFFTETAIERRRPLGPMARRAGWVGCNIRLKVIPPEGKLPLVVGGKIVAPHIVRLRFQQVRPLAQLSVPRRGWTIAVLQAVHDLGADQFSLHDAYALEPQFAQLFPKNRNIRPKIRQQLQVLRDMGLIEFLGDGHYHLRHEAPLTDDA